MVAIRPRFDGSIDIRSGLISRSCILRDEKSELAHFGCAHFLDRTVHGSDIDGRYRRAAQVGCSRSRINDTSILQSSPRPARRCDGWVRAVAVRIGGDVMEATGKSRRQGGTKTVPKVGGKIFSLALFIGHHEFLAYNLF